MMKQISQKLFVSLLAILFLTAFNSKTLQTSSLIRVKGEVCIKVKNDTGTSVTLHTGKGTAPMNSGVQKEFCLEEGSKLYFANKGQKGKLIVEFTSDMNGKKINLSDY